MTFHLTCNNKLLKKYRLSNDLLGIKQQIVTELSPPNIAKTALILGKTIATVDVTARKMAVHMTFLKVL